MRRSSSRSSPRTSRSSSRASSSLIVSADVLVLGLLRRGRGFIGRGTGRSGPPPATALARSDGAPPPEARPVSALAEAAVPSRVGARELAWGALALGVLAAFIALPPIMLRTPVPSLVLAVAAVAAGVFVVREGEKRLGWIAIVIGVLAGVGAVAATQTNESSLDAVFVWSALFAAMLRFATPLIFAALGGLLCERSGVINIGLEGMMLMGAFFGIFGADLTGSWLLGCLIGMASGGALALIHAVLSVSFRADQVVSGFGLNFLAAGITGYVFVAHYGDQGTPGDVPRVPTVSLPADRGPRLLRRGDRQREPAHLGRAAARRAHGGVPVQDAARPAPALRRREAPRCRDGRRVGHPHALRRGDRLGLPGGARRRVPLDRAARLVHGEHDRGTGLHRAGGGHLRRLAAVRRARRRRSCSASRARSRSACRSSRSRPPFSSRRSPT